MIPEFIAEIGSNHNGDWERAFDLVLGAKKVGFETVKFQYLDIENMFHPDVLAVRPDLSQRKQLNFPVEWLPEIRRVCTDNGLKFMMSVYTTAAIEACLPWVDSLKISSYDLINRKLLFRAGLSHLPVYLSTGMAYLHEVETAVEFLLANGLRKSMITLLNCTSNYPALPDFCNLAAIEILQERFYMPVGWSDHSVNTGIICRAVFHWRANPIELHLDLNDGLGNEYESGHCWTVGEAKELIDTVKDGFLGDGQRDKRPTLFELAEREWRSDPVDGLRPIKRKRGTV